MPSASMYTSSNRCLRCVLNGAFSRRPHAAPMQLQAAPLLLRAVTPPPRHCTAPQRSPMQPQCSSARSTPLQATPRQRHEVGKKKERVWGWRKMYTAYLIVRCITLKVWCNTSSDMTIIYHKHPKTSKNMIYDMKYTMQHLMQRVVKVSHLVILYWFLLCQSTSCSVVDAYMTYYLTYDNKCQNMLHCTNVTKIALCIRIYICIP